MAESKHLRLVGKIITPIVINKPFFHMRGCKVSITKQPEENERGYFPYPRRTHFGKLIKGDRRAPTLRKCFKGYVVVDLRSRPLRAGDQTEKKLKWFLNLEGLGGHQNEGMGKIQWLERKECMRKKKLPRKRKFQYLKGLGSYPEPMLVAIKALLLHDFVKTEKHISKIYREVNIENELIREACENHHNKECTADNWLIPIIRKYDGLAEFITRKIPRKITARYDYFNGELDFKELVKEIELNQYSAHELYNYIYNSKALRRIPEAMNYSNNNLRKHLLLAVNLFIADFKKGLILVKDNEIRKVSKPTKEKEEREKFLSKSKVLKRIYPSEKADSKNRNSDQVTNHQGGKPPDKKVEGMELETGYLNKKTRKKI